MLQVVIEDVWSKYVIFISLKAALDYIMQSKSGVKLPFTFTSTTLTTPSQMAVVNVYPPL